MTTSPSELKRYNIDAPGRDQYEEAPDGEWVKHADVVEKFAPLFEEGAKAIREGSAALGRLALATALLESWHNYQATEGRSEPPWEETEAFLGGLKP